MTSQRCTRSATSLTIILIILSFASPASAEWKEKVLYSFQGGKDGSLPAGGVVFDSAGNLYGVTTDGGLSCPSPGCGTVFQLAPPAKKGDPWTETVLHVFNGNDGSRPAGSVIVDAKGNLYGTTAYGGSGTCLLLGGNVGCGLVYELSPPAEKDGRWKYSILYNFQGGKDGQYPVQNLTLDATGNLYGATLYGGGYQGICNAPFYLYCGTIFEVRPPTKKGAKWKESVLHAFKSGDDGASPNGGLVIDSKGTIYGTTFYGGNENGVCKYGVVGVGCGTVFQLTTTQERVWTEKIIHRFQGGNDGDNPAAGLIFGKNGDLYGTTLTGGPRGGGGTVFRVTQAKKSGSWNKTTLYGFDGTGGGLDVESSVIFDSNGNLYGTTLDSGGTYYGTVFRLRTPKQEGGAWTFTLLYGFHAPPDGGQPAVGLVFDKSGNLYSTTQKGGTGKCSFYGCGTVFEVSP